MFKISIAGVAPFAFIIGGFVFFILFYTSKRKRWLLFKRVTMTFIVFMFVALPKIFYTILPIYNCKEITPGDFRLHDEMNVICWEG